MNMNVNDILLFSQPRLLPSLISTAFTEQQEVNPEPPSAQEQKYETREDITATFVSRERF
jgi:hypothetical protein